MPQGVELCDYIDDALAVRARLLGDRLTGPEDPRVTALREAVARYRRTLDERDEIADLLRPPARDS